jgi:hypothetical protein
VSYFYIIGGIGHCGTKWLATALHRPWDGMVCSHELLLLKAGFEKHGWWPCTKFIMENGLDERFKPYFSYIDRVSKNNIFGDAHSWPTIIVPKLADTREVKRIVYLVRNGIQNVHSFHVHTANKKVQVNHGFFSRLMRREIETFGCPFMPKRPWVQLSRFHILCFWWASQVGALKWLQLVSPETKVIVARLEDLTKPGTRDLYELACQLNPHATTNYLEATKKRDMNQKIMGDRDPKRLFYRIWSPEMREIFTTICGPAMEEFGYVVP